MTHIGTTKHGYTVIALNAGESSPMLNHKGGAEIAVDEEGRTMYAWGVFVALHGLNSIMQACESYHSNPADCLKRARRKVGA